MSNKIKVSPSILASNFSMLGEEVEHISNAGADYIHVDVMDGHFVPNLTIGPDVVKSIRDKTAVPFDVHLMIDPIEPYIDGFVNAGADIISIHPEANDDTEKCLNKIKSHNVKAGLAINPDTDWEVVKPYMNVLDLILVMSVHPGFGGQKFMIDETMPKVKEAKEIREQNNLSFHIQVDGGICSRTAKISASYGANIMVAGTGTFRAPNMKSAIDEIRNA